MHWPIDPCLGSLERPSRCNTLYRYMLKQAYIGHGDRNKNQMLHLRRFSRERAQPLHLEIQSAPERATAHTRIAHCPGTTVLLAYAV